MVPKLLRSLAAILLVSVTAVACSSTAADTTAISNTGLRTVDVDSASNLVESPVEGLVILDVRTSEEFAEGHLADAELLDFYRADFADQLAELDPSAPYLIYCRSGNRSGQTLELMTELGFEDVTNVEGGIDAWNNAGLPTAGE